ncbi:MAG: ATP-NAD kinase family protein [Leucobacter sp.]
MSVSGTIGIVVNPVAGIGGSVALTGSDGIAIQTEARARGGVPRAPERARRFVNALLRRVPNARILTANGQLGGAYVATAKLIQTRFEGATTGGDTQRLVSELVAHGVDLLVFIGGDGTARDVLAGLRKTDDPRQQQLCLGVPAGVKMHSGVFAVTPEDAAIQVAEVLSGTVGSQMRDVVDLDEAARREGALVTSVYGAMRVPAHERVQRGKRSTMGAGTSLDAVGIANALRRDAHKTIVFGPGTTVGAVAGEFGVETSLLGFDLILPDGEIHQDLTGLDLERWLRKREFAMVLSPIGGQGFLIGRGNHQLTEQVLTWLDPDQLFIVADAMKLGEVGGKLRIDAPTLRLNERFIGIRTVLMGEHDVAVVTVV